ncbi:MAG: hypothetical protein HND43_00970 [Armatimonadetes bacterium]|nr:MAG: hypothetical protein EDM74_05580 [Armatimonadota bacterium]MBV6490687.1 hypothetical protein [Fimbriimonadaceae bacterium]QOJ10989.1 MAG: hypothetical protein HRU74_02605 [Chthonomonadaceae bacterium]MCK6631436.1 hypothetical protein [Fimbriimonadaceae bacterium]MCL4284165.1 hypothetical protein [Fimbriimonadaceae bacterium]
MGYMKALVGFALFVSLLLAGCAGNKLVGTWDATGGPVAMKYTFGSDGSMKVLVSLPLPTGTAEFTAVGKYTVDGDSVTTVGESVSVKGVTGGLVDMIKSEAEKQLKKEVKSKITWESNDRFTLDMDGQVVTFNRVKQ